MNVSSSQLRTDEFTLIAGTVMPLRAAHLINQGRGIPGHFFSLALLDIQADEVPDAYLHRLVLSRPDQHVA